MGRTVFYLWDYFPTTLIHQKSHISCFFNYLFNKSPENFLFPPYMILNNSFIRGLQEIFLSNNGDENTFILSRPRFHDKFIRIY